MFYSLTSSKASFISGISKTNLWANPIRQYVELPITTGQIVQATIFNQELIYKHVYIKSIIDSNNEDQ